MQDLSENSYYQILLQALRWSFCTFGDHIRLYVPLLLIGGCLILGASVVSLGLLFLPVSFYITLCFVKMAFAFYNNEYKNRKNFWVSFGTFWRCLLALLLYALMVTVGLLFFIIPGLYLASRYYYVVYCIIGDKHSILGSFSYSARITRGKCWLTFFSLLVATFFGYTFILLPVAALMNVHTYFYCKNKLL